MIPGSEKGTLRPIRLFCLVDQVEAEMGAQIINRPAVEFNQTVGTDPQGGGDFPEAAVFAIVFFYNPALPFS